MDDGLTSRSRTGNCLKLKTELLSQPSMSLILLSLFSGFAPIKESCSNDSAKRLSWEEMLAPDLRLGERLGSTSQQTHPQPLISLRNVAFKSSAASVINLLPCCLLCLNLTSSLLRLPLPLRRLLSPCAFSPHRYNIHTWHERGTGGGHLTNDQQQLEPLTR